MPLSIRNIIPYIGSSAEHQYSATGYAGNGLTFGTLAGVMMTDAILGRANPWAELFDPNRKALTRGLWDYLKENVDYPYYMIRDRFAGADVARCAFATMYDAAAKMIYEAVVDLGASMVESWKAIPGRFPLSAVVLRDLQDRVVAGVGGTMRAIPETHLRPDTLRQSGEGEAATLSWDDALPESGGRVPLLVGRRQVGWLDVWGDGGSASAESWRELSDVGRLLALLLDGARPA